jgi:hypothetical protein
MERKEQKGVRQLADTFFGRNLSKHRLLHPIGTFGDIELIRRAYLNTLYFMGKLKPRGGVGLPVCEMQAQRAPSEEGFVRHCGPANSLDKQYITI